jgi:hypothetical protein
VRCLAARQAPEKDRDDAGLPVRILARPVHVAVAQRDVPGPVQPVVHREVLLAGELGRSIGRERLARRIFGRRVPAFAVHGAPRGGEHDLRPVGPRCFEDLQRAARVHVEIEHGILHRHAHVGLRCEVEADLRPEIVEHGHDRVPVADVDDRQADVLVHVRLATLREVVDDEHLVLAGDERVGDVRADEAGSACHDRPHGQLS